MITASAINIIDYHLLFCMVIYKISVVWIAIGRCFKGGLKALVHVSLVKYNLIDFWVCTGMVANNFYLAFYNLFVVPGQNIFAPSVINISAIATYF